MIKDINIPIICPGTVLEIPVEEILVTANAIDFAIVVTVPAGVTFSHAVLPKGSYDAGTDTWNVGSVTNGELIQGLLYYTVVDDSKAPFEFSFTIGTSEVCEGYCVKVSGLTCYQLSCCESAVQARDSDLVAPPGQAVGPINVTINDGLCANRTFAWLNDAGGKVTGTPEAAVYTPDAEFFGTQIAEYGLYCSGKLTDTARVHLATTYAAVTTQWNLMPTNSVYAGNVRVADLGCTNGGVTTVHLKNAPTADGAVIYATTDPDCTVTEWNINTGNYQLTCINSVEAVVLWDYFIRCEKHGKTWDSGPGQEIVSVTASFPFSSSRITSSSGAPSSSIAPSSSGLLSSSVPASSSAPASSSDTSSVLPPSSSATSSIVPESSSELIPSSDPAASSSLPFSSSNPTSSSTPVSSGTPTSSSFAFLSSSQVTSSSAPVSSSTAED